MRSRGEQTKESILKAAVGEFSEKGFHGARVDSIAERAQVNKQRVYAYYGSKENIFFEVLSHCLSGVAEVERDFENLTEADVPDLASIMLMRYVEYHETNPHFWRILAWENLSDGTHLEKLREVHQREFTNFRKLYSHAQDIGVFDKQISFEAFLFMLSALAFFSFSNQKTMSHILNLDLANSDVRGRLLAESLALVGLVKGQ